MQTNPFHITFKDIRPAVVAPSQACVLLSIGMTRCYELMNCGALESFKDGKKSRKITVRSIEAYVQSRPIEELKAAACELDDQKKVRLMPGFLEWVCDQIEEVLAARDPEVRQRTGSLYVLAPDGPIRAEVHLLGLRTMRIALFIDDARNRRVDPPLKSFAALLRKGAWRFPQLECDSE